MSTTQQVEVEEVEKVEDVQYAMIRRLLFQNSLNATKLLIKTINSNNLIKFIPLVCFCLNLTIERSDLISMKQLLPYCSVDHYRKLLFTLMCKRHRHGCKMFKMLIDRGAKLDDSDNSYTHLSNYIIR